MMLEQIPRRLQDTMGRGFPVAMHSKMAVWWTLMVRFWGPDRMTGSRKVLDPDPGWDRGSVRPGSRVKPGSVGSLRPASGLTGDAQLSLAAQSRVGDVGGDAAERTAVSPLNSRDLQHAVGQQRVPARWKRPTFGSGDVNRTTVLNTC